MTLRKQFEIEWLDKGREPQCAPDPNFPNGKDVDLRRSADEPGCTVTLPYPAKRCGLYIVTCGKCRIRVDITTAGRPDDLRNVTIPCKPLPN